MNNDHWVEQLYEIKKAGQPFVLVTVTRFIGSTPRETGAKLILKSDGTFLGSIGGGNVERMVLEDALKVLQQGQSRVFKYPLGALAGQCCGGSLEVLMEAINCGPQLYIFGAGHVGQSICQVMEGTAFTLHLIDPRPDWLHNSSLPQNVVRHESWEIFLKQSQWHPLQSYAVILTHSHALDQDILQEILSSQKKFRYLGLIGSKSKWMRFQRRLLAAGISQKALEQVSCPIGLRTGGKAPKEVAISLAAQLQAIFYDQLTQPISLGLTRSRKIQPHGASQGLNDLSESSLGPRAD